MLELATSHLLTKHLEVPEEPQNIFILILSIFSFYTSQPKDIVGCPLVIIIIIIPFVSSKSTDPFQHAATPLNKAIKTPWMVTVNSVGFRCRPTKEGNNRCALLLEDFYVFLNIHVQSPTLSRLLKGHVVVFTGWHRRTSSPWTGSLTLAQAIAEGPLWHGLRSTTSSLPLLLRPLSCQCWPPSSAAPPASWLEQCWLCYCSPSALSVTSLVLGLVCLLLRTRPCCLPAVQSAVYVRPTLFLCTFRLSLWPKTHSVL